MGKGVKRIFVKGLLWAGVLAGVLLATGALILGALQTGQGRARAAALLCELLREPALKEIRLGEMEGFFPVRFRMARVGLVDQDGEWLWAEEIRVAWSPLALLGGRLRVQDFDVARIHWERSPAVKTRIHEAEAGPFRLPGFLWGMELSHLAVKRLSFGERHLGEMGQFEVEAGMGRTAKEGLQARFLFERRGGPVDRAAAEIVYTRDGFLRLNAAIEEDRGGILSMLLGVEGPLRLDLRGEGPQDDWSGVLGMVVGDLGRLDTEVHIKGVDSGSLLALRGTLKPGPELPSPLASILTDDATLALKARLFQGKRVDLDLVSVRSGPFLVTLRGSWDPEGDLVAGEFTIAHEDLSVLKSALGTPLSGRIALHGVLDGSIASPRVFLSGEVLDPEILGVGAGRAEAHLQLRAETGPGSRLEALGVKGHGCLEGLSLPELGGLTGDNPSWEIEAEWRPPQALHVGELRLGVEGGALFLSGTLDLDKQRAAVWGEARIPDLRVLSRVLGVSVALGTTTRFDLGGDWTGSALSASIEGEVVPRSGSTEMVSFLLGGPVQYEGAIEIEDRRWIRVSALRARSVRWEVRGLGTLDLEGDAVSGSGRVVIPDVAWLSPIAGLGLEGAADLQGKIRGSLSSPLFDGSLLLDRFLVEDVTLGKVAVHFEGRGHEKGVAGHLGIDLRPGRVGQVSASTDIDLRMPRLSLSRTSVQAPQGDLRGDLAVAMDNKTVTGELRSRLRNLAGLVPGDWGGDVELQARLEVINGIQHLSIVSKGDAVRTPLGTAEEFSILGRVIDPLGKAQGSVRAEVRGMHSGKAEVKALRLDGEGNLERLRFSGRAEGRYVVDLEMETAGTLWHLSSPKQVELSRLSLSGPDTSVRLVGPVLMKHEEGAWHVEDVSLRIGSGDLHGSALIRADRLSTEAQFQWIPLDLLRLAGLPVVSGRAAGRVTLNATPGGSRGSARVRVEDLIMGGISGTRAAGLAAEGDATLDHGRLRVRMDLEGFSGTALKGHLEMPLLLRAAPVSLEVPAGALLSGELTGDMDIARILAILGQEEQIVGGRLEVDLRIDGPHERPAIRGRGRLSEGFYENVETGTLLREVNVVIRGDEQGLSLENLKATDGASGKVSAQGRIRFDPARKFPFEVKATLEKAKLLQMDEATATCDGSVILSGDTRDVLLSGKVQVGPADLRIPDRLPPQIVEIEVIELDGQEKKDKEDVSSPLRQEKSRIRLDVALTSPGRVFLRGMGLDSEWEGSLNAGGTTTTPVLTGTLSLVRGHLDFFGKRFVVTRGEFLFDGSYPPSPILDLEAKAAAAEITARLSLSGRLLSLNAELKSEPPLPPDEVLSRLLFGRSGAEITPVQALTLADAVLTLTGGGPGIMDKARQTLGVDRLEFKGGDADEAAIGAGKYLTEGIYVEVERGLDPQSSKASVQVEITPQISFVSQIGANSEGGVGLRWKWNY